MYNANKPNPEELPTSKQLLKSTIIAMLSAIVILVVVVLPAEYGIDPTRLGRVLGLAEMGEIKMQLAEEAEADRRKELQRQEDRSSFLDRFLSVFVSTAYAHSDEHDHSDEQDHSEEPEWTDTVSITLAPTEGVEIKLVMAEGAVAEFRWVAEGGKVNYDLHGDGDGHSISYVRGRSVPGHEGTLTAAFTGNHGWFWRNRDSQDVTVTLFVRGNYSDVMRVE